MGCQPFDVLNGLFYNLEDLCKIPSSEKAFMASRHFPECSLLFITEHLLEVVISCGIPEKVVDLLQY